MAALASAGEKLDVEPAFAQMAEGGPDGGVAGVVKDEVSGTDQVPWQPTLLSGGHHGRREKWGVRLSCIPGAQWHVLRFLPVLAYTVCTSGTHSSASAV